MTELDTEPAAGPEEPRGLKSKRTLLAGVGVITAFALVAGPLALARKADPKAPGPRVFSGIETGSEEQDIQPNGASIGDAFTSTQTLAEGGGPAGSWDASCSYVRVVREKGNPTPVAVSLECIGVVRLGDDTLTFQGLNNYQRSDALAISKFVVTGGTGAFRNARGELRQTDLGNGASTVAYDTSGGNAAES